MQNIENILVSTAVFAAITIVIIALLNFILRMRILKSGHKDENYIRLLYRSLEYKLNELKWGILLLFGGLALVVIEFLPDSVTFESPLPYGIATIFLAAGFLTYYLIVKKQNK